MLFCVSIGCPLRSVKFSLSPSASVGSFAVGLSTEVSFFIEIGDISYWIPNGSLNKSKVETVRVPGGFS